MFCHCEHPAPGDADAIQYAHERFISRSKGGNAVRSAAYNAHTVLVAERTGERFSFDYWGWGPTEYHEVLLPTGADERFRDPAALWNAVEFAEKQKNSQVARELVIALPAEPADPGITTQDRIELARSFAVKCFVDKGLAVQIDLHVPHGQDRRRDNEVSRAFVDHDAAPRGRSPGRQESA